MFDMTKTDVGDLLITRGGSIVQVSKYNADCTYYKWRVSSVVNAYEGYTVDSDGFEEPGHCPLNGDIVGFAEEQPPCESVTKNEGVKDGSAKPAMLLTGDATDRKQIPVVTGLLDYFPLALAEVAKCSKAGNDQHHPGEPLHWDKSKSTDHIDCIGRHLIDRNSLDTDGIQHDVKLAWRALAHLQIRLEKEKS
jgi:hypothetical protein